MTGQVTRRDHIFDNHKNISSNENYQDKNLQCKIFCPLIGNRALFGQSGAVAPLVNYLTSSSVEVHRSTSVALYQLSKDPWNCVTMHQNGVVPHLLRLIGNNYLYLLALF